MRDTDGIYGGCFSNAGFKGGCMALVNPGETEEVVRAVSGRYIITYPTLDGHYSARVCASADGVGIAL